MDHKQNSSGPIFRFRFLFLLVLLLVAGLNISSVMGETTHKNYRVEVKQPTPEMQSISSLLVQVLIRQHYENKPFSDDLSETIFNEYLKRLDPLHMFFMASDIERLSAQKKTLASRLLRGDTAFAFETFNLMLSRMKQYGEFADQFLKGPINLETNEEFRLDHDKAPWPETEAEMRDFWRKKLTHELIMSVLADRAVEEERAKTPAEKNEAKKDDTEKKTPEERIRQRVHRTVNYYLELEPLEVLEIYLTTVVQIYDPHSSYMSPRTNEQFDIEMSLSLVGIGATLTSDEGYTKVVELVAGGPADKQGELKAGDRIIAVQQEGAEAVDVIDMPLDKVVGMIRGKEATKVTLTVLPAGKGMANPKKITIIRAKIELKEAAAKGEIRENGGKKIGVIALPSFYVDFEAAKLGVANYRSASADVKRILEDFNKQKVDAVVMDLRSNGGGSLREAILLTGLFIKDGPVVQVRDRRETAVQNDEDDGEVVYAGPLAVLVNRFSASSSEIFTAAIRDYNRGIVLGDAKTHGKGTVQFVNDLDRYMPFHVGRRFPAGSIRLTNAKFYRINGESTQIKGVAADIAFPSFTDSMDIGEDKLDHALAWDTIPKTEFQPYTGPWALNDALRSELKKRSEKRQADSREFQLLKQNIAEYDKIKDRKTVTLNLEERWKEYQAQKKFQDEQEALYDAASGAAGKSKEKDKKRDLYLEETISILNDLIRLAPGA